MQRNMRTPSGISTSKWSGQVCFGTKEMSGMRDIYQVGGLVLPVLRLQAEDKAKERSEPKEDGEDGCSDVKY